jgi:hypothetical protein
MELTEDLAPRREGAKKVGMSRAINTLTAAT